MLNLEERITRVWHPEVRPLVAEAYRCHSTGTPRAAIVLTWTAVCADLIHKLYQLSEDGEGIATAVVQRIDSARGKDDKLAVRTMQQVENGLLQNALELEIIDFTEHRQLERLQQDRNLCAHPSLRPLGEAFTPSPEYARAHLVSALDALLVHPPSQGRKAVERFAAHVAGPSFVGSADYLVKTFAEPVKSTARKQILSLAAKHSMLELPVDASVAIGADVFAARMALCLRVFAQHDRTAAHEAIASAMVRLNALSVEQQLRAIMRLGDLDVFSDELDSTVCGQINTYIERMQVPVDASGTIAPWSAAVLALAGIDGLLALFPALEWKFAVLHPYQQAEVIQLRPGAYFTSFLAKILREAGSWRGAERLTEKALLPCAPFIEPDQLTEILTAWVENPQCRAAAEMPKYAVIFWAMAPQLWGRPEWTAFITRARALEPTLPHYHYETLAKSIGYADGTDAP